VKYGTEIYNNVKLPVWVAGNIFYNGAKPYEKEENFIESSNFDPEIKLKEEGGKVYLNLIFDQKYFDQKREQISSEKLGKAKIPKAGFENPDGTSLIFDTDYFGNIRSAENSVAGPFVNLKKGPLLLKLW
jgi:hypothetical protein